MNEYRKKEIIKAFIAIFIIIIAIFIAFSIVLKYQVEGEKDIPFTLSKITVVSTAEGIENKEAKEKWNLSVFQNNDVYFSIEKNNENVNDEIIQSVSIKNIEITKQPEKGTVTAFMPNSSEGRLFNNSEETVISEKGLTYKGSSKSDSKTLEIGNQGGTAVVRFSLTDIGKYVSDEAEEIRHDGSLLSKIGLNEEQINFEVTFDLVIKLKDSTYSSKITLELPCENLIKQGTSSNEITEGFVFKRINK